MLIRNAEKADIPTLVALRRAYLQEDLGPLTQAQEAALQARLPGYFARNLGSCLHAYLAEAAGQTAAIALLLVSEKPYSPAFPTGLTGTVLNVYTRPSFRRQGLARAVMQHLLLDVAARGICRVDLKATPMGLPLYRALGFTPPGGDYLALEKYLK